MQDKTDFLYFIIVSEQTISVHFYWTIQEQRSLSRIYVQTTLYHRMPSLFGRISYDAYPVFLVYTVSIWERS